MKISIMGSGYVGLVTGACLATSDQHVTCLDIDEKKIENLKVGKIPIYEPGLEELIKEKLENNSLSFSSNINQAIGNADAIFIAVGTPTNIENDGANLSQVFSCADEIAKNIKNNTVVIVKSTVPVGVYKAELFITLYCQLTVAGLDIKLHVTPEVIVVGYTCIAVAEVFIYIGLETLGFSKGELI